MFVEKCGDEMKRFCVGKEITWEEIEGRLIKPFLEIVESGSDPSALEAKGFGAKNAGGMGEYGLSKAAVNCYTMELARRFPSLTVTSCSPGFIETDLTKGFATQAGKSPAEMGMLSVDQVPDWLSPLLLVLALQGARCPVYLMTGDLSSLPDFSGGWYFGSDSLRSPLHK